MRKIKTDEIAISKSIKEGNPSTLEAYKMMMFYLKIYDELHNTNHFKNAKKLYLKRNNESIIKLSSTLNTEERSLTRYRNIYLKCYKFCASAIKKFGGFLNFLNKLM